MHAYRKFRADPISGGDIEERAFLTARINWLFVVWRAGRLVLAERVVAGMMKRQSEKTNSNLNFIVSPSECDAPKRAVEVKDL